MTISIVTACRNSELTIADCIESVQSQTEAVQHIVVDGASCDGTLRVVEGYGNHIAQVISEPDGGVYDAMNKGISLASSEIVGTLNADDFYADSSVISTVLSVFDDPSVAACYGDLCYVRSNNPDQIIRYWRAGNYQTSRLRNGWMPPHPTFFVRRKIYQQFGLYKIDLGTAADYELMLRYLLKHQINVAYIPEILVHMRSGGASNASWKARFKANQMDRRAWQVNGLKPRPWTFLAKPLRKLPQWWQRPVSE